MYWFKIDFVILINKNAKGAHVTKIFVVTFIKKIINFLKISQNVLVREIYKILKWSQSVDNVFHYIYEYVYVDWLYKARSLKDMGHCVFASIYTLVYIVYLYPRTICDYLILVLVFTCIYIHILYTSIFITMPPGPFFFVF